jgi:hypothetical protein
VEGQVQNAMEKVIRQVSLLAHAADNTTSGPAFTQPAAAKVKAQAMDDFDVRNLDAPIASWR